MPWRVEYTPRAQKNLRDLPRERQKQIQQVDQKMRQDPWSTDIKKLQGKEDEYRIRVGVYRLRVVLDLASQTITVIAIAHRQSAY